MTQSVGGLGVGTARLIIAPRPGTRTASVVWRAAEGIMLRALLPRALPGLTPLSLRRFSAAAIPAPSTRPEVHYNKVEH